MKVSNNKIQTLNTLLPILEKRRKKGDRVVFTNGCFDLIHIGHVRYLTKAKSFGDLLVIAVNSDETVRKLKGDGRPVMPCEERKEVLAAFSFCDYVVEFTESTPRQIISKILPDVLVKGGDWPLDQIVGRDIVLAHNGKVERIKEEDGKSTTNIIQRIIDQGFYG